MKLLFLMPDMSQFACRILHHWIELEMDKIADCKFAGLGTPNYKREGVQATVDRLYNGDSPDWVIIDICEHDPYWDHYKVPTRRDWKIARHTQDIHDNATKGPSSSFIRRVNGGGYDAVLMKIIRLRWDGDPDYILKNLKPRVFYYPFHGNPEVLKPSDEPKLWDVGLLGATNYGPYPLRYQMKRRMPFLAKRSKLRYLTSSWPPGADGKTGKDRLERLLVSRLKNDKKYKYYVGDDYYEVVSRTKLMLFDSSRYGYPVQKYFEYGFLKSLMLTDLPLEADVLHFEAGWNFVEVNLNNWQGELRYYLKHENDRLEIIENAYETMMKHHTSKIRARQLLTFLEENR